MKIQHKGGLIITDLEQITQIVDQMAKPPGSLGLLESQIKKLYCCWGKLHKELNPCHLIFAADNGIAEESVVRQPQEITYLQAKNMVDGKATISCFCKKIRYHIKLLM